jgi:putative transposase
MTISGPGRATATLDGYFMKAQATGEALEKTYFVTLETRQRRPVFSAASMADLLVQQIYEQRGQKRFALHEFVIMPDHVHLLLTPRAMNVEQTIQLLKDGFAAAIAQQLGLRSEIWGQTFSDRRIRDGADYQMHARYICGNPVRHLLAEHPEDYLYCSARRQYELDPPPEALGGTPL